MNTALKKTIRILLLCLAFSKVFAQSTNIDFGTGNINGWVFEEAWNLNSFLMTTGTYSASTQYSVMAPGSAETHTLPIAMTSPLGGNFVRIGNTNNGGYAHRLNQTFRVTSAFPELAVSYAIVIDNGGEGHQCNDQPFFYFVLKDSLGNVINNSNVYSSASGTTCTSGDPSFVTSAGGYRYKNWVNSTFSLQEYIGTNITIECIASGCSVVGSGHPCYAYIDASMCNNNFTSNILSINTNTYNLAQSQSTILVCGTNTANIVAPSGAASYSWTGTGITGLTTQSVSVSQIGTYQLMIDRPSVCSNTTAVTIKIFSTSPTVSVPVSSGTVCAGFPITMTAEGALYYTWTPYSFGSSGNNTSFTQTYTPYPNVSTVYTVTGTDANGCAGTAQYSVSVSPTPTLTISGNTVICLGNSTLLTATGADTYNWGSGITTNTNLVSPTFNNTYGVTGYFTSTGCARNGTIAVAVNTTTLNITSSPSSPTVCPGTTVNLTASGASSYTWSTGTNGVSEQVNPTVATTYIVSGTNACGIVTKTLTISTYTLPNIMITSAPATVCTSASFSLQAGGGISYTWTPINATASVVTTSLTQLPGQTYTVTGKNAQGCVNTASVFVSAVAPPSLSITNTSSVLCLGQTATLSVSGASNYLWSNSANTQSIVISPTVSTTYSVSGYNTSGCVGKETTTITVVSNPTINVTGTNQLCQGSSSGISANGASTYTWSTGAITSSIVVTPTVSDVYTVTGTNSNNCSSTRTIGITVNSLPLVTVNSGTICQGENFIINANGANTYVYSSGTKTVSPTTNTTYTITGIDVNSCIARATCSVSVNPKPTIIVNDGSICVGETYTITPSGADIYTYSGGSNSVNPITTTIYTVSGTDVNNCSNTQTVSITVNPLPVIAVNSGTVCSGNSFIITPSGADTYSYSIGSNVVTPISDINITVTGTDINGCQDNVGAVSSLSVIATPTITATSNASIICEGSSIELSSTGADSYLWNTGATTQSLTTIPTVSTIYTVTGTNPNNCSTTQTVSVTVDNTCQYVWPGDANSDGMADNLDVLELGLHYTQAGAPRASTSNSWQSYFANNWTGTITNGKNLNHSDCNGDGTINDDDTLAIYNNYGLTHAFKMAQTNTVNPQLSIIPDQAGVVTGSWGTASVYLGDAANTINNINGVAFTVDFDNTLIETNNIYLEYQPSFIDASQNLHFRKLDFTNGKLFTATTHTVSNNVNGFGKIATLHYQIKSNLGADQVLNIGISQANQSDASGSIVPLTSGTGTLMAIASSVGLLENINTNFISISPNPTNGVLTINSKTELQKVEVIAITGQILISEIPVSTNHQLHLETFANGIYFVNVYQNNHIVKREKIVLNK